MMIEGCKKNVVYIRNTGSKVFDEAYFVVSDSDDMPPVKGNDMVTEAKKLITELVGEELTVRESKAGNKCVHSFLWFISGVAVTLLLNLTVFFLL